MKRNKETKRSKKIPFNKNCIAMLNALYHGNKEQRKNLLRNADKSLIKCICECVLNILRGTVSLKNGVKKRLKKYKNVLRRIASSCVTKQRGGGRKRVRHQFNWKAKKRLIIQQGGGMFIPLLLAPIISTLVSRLFAGGEAST